MNVYNIIINIELCCFDENKQLKNITICHFRFPFLLTAFGLFLLSTCLLLKPPTAPLLVTSWTANGELRATNSGLNMSIFSFLFVAL